MSNSSSNEVSTSMKESDAGSSDEHNGVNVHPRMLNGSDYSSTTGDGRTSLSSSNQSINTEVVQSIHDEENPHLILSRSISRNITQSSKILKEATESVVPVPSMGGGRDHPPSLYDIDQYVVIFDDNDPLDPIKWPLKRKFINCIATLCSPLTVQFGSAFLADSLPHISKLYGVNNIVATLATSLFIFGFAAGPVIWGPLSELYGRRPILLLSAFGYICFAFAAATSKDIQTLMLTRFFCGFIGGASAVVAPSSMADLFIRKDRGKSVIAFGMIIFCGPMISPIMAGFLAEDKRLSWRWPLYLTGFGITLAFTIMVFFMKETHSPTILVKKAELIRRKTGNKAVHAAHEEVSLSVSEIIRYNILRPLKMLITEPILFLMSLYNSFMYGIMYLLLTAIPIAFKGNYKFSTGISNLPYIATIVGVLMGGLILLYFDIRLSKKAIVIPEDRIPPMFIGSFLFPLGMFWFGWTADYPEKIHWIVPAIGTAFLGAGLVTIFLPCLTYILDAYISVSASALALNAFLRSSFGGAFPLFAKVMFKALSLKWGTTLLGGFSILLIPVPFIFFRYGERIRSKTKYHID